MVADYNAGSINTETFFQELIKFTKTLSDEDARSISEGLTEEQLALFDLLMRPAPNCPTTRRRRSRVAEELLTILKREKLVLDWRKEQNTRAAVRVAVEEVLDLYRTNSVDRSTLRNAMPSTSMSSTATGMTVTLCMTAPPERLANR